MSRDRGGGKTRTISRWVIAELVQGRHENPSPITRTRVIWDGANGWQLVPPVGNTTDGDCLRSSSVGRPCHPRDPLLGSGCGSAASQAPKACRSSPTPRALCTIRGPLRCEANGWQLVPPVGNTTDREPNPVFIRGTALPSAGPSLWLWLRPRAAAGKRRDVRSIRRPRRSAARCSASKPGRTRR